MDSEQQSLKDLQSHLLGMVKIFHNICAKNNLTYFIIGGTFLGAVRHQGFIPWDDDIDIGMPRKDYEKFKNLPKEEFRENYECFTKWAGQEKGSFLYIKLVDSNTTIVENSDDKQIEGVFIDIFPLDGAGNTKIGSKIKYFVSRLYSSSLRLNAKTTKHSNVLKRTAQNLLSSLNNRKIYNVANKFLSKTDYDKSKYVGNFLGNWGFREIMNKSILGAPILYQFEDTKLYGPQDSKQFLTKIYGDYMKLPPIEKRSSHHSFEFLSLTMNYKEYLKTFSK